MSQTPPNRNEPQRGGRGLGWAALIVGILLCLGTLSSIANGTSGSTTGAAETAGRVVAGLLFLALGIAGIVFGIRRISR